MNHVSTLTSECEWIWILWILFFFLTNGFDLIDEVHEIYSDSHGKQTSSIEEIQNETIDKRQVFQEESNVPCDENRENLFSMRKLSMFINTCTVWAALGRTTVLKRKKRDEILGLNSEQTIQSRWKRRKSVGAHSLVREKYIFISKSERIDARWLRNRTRAQSFREYTEDNEFEFEIEKPKKFEKEEKDLRRTSSCGDFVFHSSLSSSFSSSSSGSISFCEKNQLFSSDLTLSSCSFLSQSDHYYSFLFPQKIPKKEEMWTLVSIYLQKAGRKALNDILESMFSFMIYALVIFLIRQNCALVLGVSLDLGSFSIEL